MIAIQSQDGELVKVLKNVVDGEFGFHKSFGVISKTRAEERIITKKRQCFDFTSDEWHCSFKIESKADEKQFKLLALAGCEAVFEKEMWILKTPMGTFNVSNALDSTISPLLEDHEDKASWLDKVSYLSFLLIFLLIPIYYYLSHETKPVVDVDKVEEPITVQIVKPVKTVKIEQMINPTITTDAKVKNVTSKQAVQRNLGFLGMVGSKDLSKVVGGVPQNLKVATAGAGPGGDAGSGGEVLTGLGKGLRKTTVGNTGVQGLGGVGTKGAGGGLGGYGNTLVASGSGKGISALAVSNSEMVMEGGLSKYVINATIAKYLSQVRRCYESELKNSPELQGLVEMSFEINASGRLNFANVSKTTLNSPPVESCISTKMMDWQFPNPKGGVTVPVKYPFMLRPVGN